MNASAETNADKPLDTFVIDKGSVVLGLVASAIFWTIGIALSNRILGMGRNYWFLIIYGAGLSILAGWMVRMLIRLAATRICVHAEAFGFWRYRRLILIPWNRIALIRAESNGFITLTAAEDKLVFNADLYKRGGELKRVLYRKAIEHGVRWSGASPADVGNLRMPVAPNPYFRLLRLLIVASGWLWFASAVPFFSDMGVHPWAFFLITQAGAVIAIVWVILSLFSKNCFRQPFGRWWLSVPLAAALGIAMGATDWALAARIALFESDLNAYVETVKPESRESSKRRVGSFDFDSTEKADGGVYLYSFMKRSGIAYLSPGAKPPIEVRLEGRLFGDWHRFERR